ncbi:MAG TPA: M48 family metalloprotease [Gaiellaceae bacterium]|nr:M48 family metalloprotease [Gaiellaceae bacterium]
MNSLDFSHEEVERSRRYHRPRYLALAGKTALATGVLVGLRFAGDAFDGLGWAGAALLWAAVVPAAQSLVTLPLDLWNGHERERRWGFSTQSLAGWLGDRGKGLAISVVLTAAAWLGLVALARAAAWWAAPAAVAAALVVLFLSFVAPVVLEPVFNRFAPLQDAELAARLHALARRAGAPVREILVADASRRTTKINAYVSGLGASRRVVVWDTLLEAAGGDGVELVVAHELGHRRLRHVAKLSAAAMALAAAFVLVLRAALGRPAAGDLPDAALLAVGFEVVLLPFLNALSRRYERQADRFAIELAGGATFAETMRELSRRNLSDLDPPRLAYVLLFSHPTPSERLALAAA